MPVRQRAGDLERLLGVHQPAAGEAGAQRGDRVGGQGGEVGEGLMLDFAGVPVAAAQQEGDILAVLVLAHNTRDVDGTGPLSHMRTLPHQPLIVTYFTGYIQRHQSPSSPYEARD